MADKMSSSDFVNNPIMPDPMDSMFPEVTPEGEEEFDIIENEDGSASIVEPEEQAPGDTEFYDNLVELLDPGVRQSIVNQYLDYIEIDKEARKRRDKQYEDGLKRTGMGNDAPGGADFQGASRVVHPMLTKACIDFESRVIKEIFPPGDAGPFDIRVNDKFTEDKFKRAKRKRAYLNRELSSEKSDYRIELEKTLTQVPMGGSQYIKWKWDDRYGVATAEFVPIDFIILPFSASSIYTTTRLAHQQDINEIEFTDRVQSGLYYDYESLPQGELPEQTDTQKANDKIEGKEEDPYNEDGLRRIYEIHCMMNIAEDKRRSSEYSYAPYILIIDDSTRKMLALRRNWEEKDERQRRMQWFVEYPFIYWRGAYGIGIPHLAGGLSAAATGALRALLDSAHINNAPTALKLKGGGVTGQSPQITVGQVTEIASSPDITDIRQVAMPLPFNQPSPILFELLGFLDQKGEAIIRTSLDNLVDMGGHMPVGTTLALIQQGLSVFSAIYARLYDAQAKTLEVLHRIYRMYLPDEIRDDDGEILVYRHDFEGEVDLKPIGDPRIFSDTQKLMQIEGLLARSDARPDLYNARALERRYVELLGIANIDEILPDPKRPPDIDPVTENIRMALGEGVVPLPDQDHLAHIQVHMDFMNSPLFGQNQMLSARLMPLEAEHIMQHIIYEYGSDALEAITKAVGVKAEDLLDRSEENRKQLSRAFAAGSPAILQQEQQKFARVIELLNQMIQAIQQQQMAAQQQQMQVAMAADPANKIADAQAQAAITDAQTKQMDVQAKTQQGNQKIEIEARKIAADLQKEKIKSDTEILKNVQDNQTAVQIAGMRSLQGESVGNIKNGNSFDNPQ